MGIGTEQTASEGRVVVFVDDEVDFVGAVYDLLCGEFGAQDVAAFADPVDADHWLNEHRPGVLVADVRMPKLNGIELVTRARRRWPGLPVIITTAYPSELADGFVDERTLFYLPKPFAFDDLLSLLRSIQESEVAQDRHKTTEIVEILTLYTMAGYTGVLSAHADGWPSARVWLRGGQVLHAQCGSMVGLPGLAALLAMPEGVFDWSRDANPAVSIDAPLGEALTQAFQLLDSHGLAFPPKGEVGDKRPRKVLTGTQVSITGRHPSMNNKSTRVGENPLADLPPEVEVDLYARTGEHPVVPSSESVMANNINEVLNELSNVEGFIAAAIADSNSGMALGKAGGGASFNIELAAAANTDVVKAKLRAMKSLKLDEGIEDMLITLGSQYHLIRPLKKRPEVFFYVALDRRRANLAVARFALADAEEKVVL